MKNLLLLVISLVLSFTFWGCNSEIEKEGGSIWPSKNREIARQGEFVLKENVWEILLSEYEAKKGYNIPTSEENGYLISNLKELAYGAMLRKKGDLDEVLSKEAFSRVEDAMAKFVSKELVQIYYDQSPEELLEWAKNHPELNCQDLSEICMIKAAKSRVENRNDLEGFFKENRYKWRKKQQYKIAWIRFDKKSLFDVLETKIKAGVPFAELANEYSTERESAPKGGELGFYFKGVNPGPLQAFVKQINRELVEKGEVKAGTLLRLNYEDKLFGILKVQKYIPFELPQMSDVEKYARSELHKKVAKDLSSNLFSKLMKKYKVEYRFPIPSSKAKEFYEGNKQLMNSPMQLSVSVNGKSEGIVKCKQGHSYKLPLVIKKYGTMPCGLGVNTLYFEKLMLGEKVNLGTAKGAVELALIKKKGTEQKSFERMKEYINQILKEGYIAYPDSAVLAKSDGKTWVNWQELKQLMYSVPAQKRKSIQRQEWMESILKRKLYSTYFKESSWAKSPRWQAEKELLMNRLAIQYSKVPVASSKDSASAKQLNSKYFKYWKGLPYHPLYVYKVFQKTPALTWKRVAYKNNVAWSDVTEEIKAKWLKGVFGFMDKALQEQKMLNEVGKFEVFYADTLLEYASPTSINEVFEQGEKYLKQGEVSKQWALYDWALEAFFDSPQMDTLLFVKAKSWVDRGQASKSVKKLKELDVILDQGVLHSKVLFMLGWVLMEKEKKNKEALVYFKKIVKQYPKSELLDDAKFMIKDIKSDGRYSRELMEKLGGH
jgi:hypothetical protein